MDRAALNLLEKQLQSLLLQLSMVDSTVGTFQQGWSWDLCLLLLPDTLSAPDSDYGPNQAVTTALQTQEWIIDGVCAPTSCPPPEAPGTEREGLSGSPASSTPRPATAKVQLLRPITSKLFNCEVLVYKAA